MHSLRSKITMLTVCAIIVTLTAATILSTTSIRDLGVDSSNQILYLMCETGQKNLNTYFTSVEQSVETVSSYALADLEHHQLTDEDLEDHLDHVRDIFEKMATNTVGVLTYYYRIDPSVSKTCDGFWYVNLDRDGFREHEVTDITKYDTNDTTKLVWFTVPKATGRSVWLPPYITDNLDVSVLSYNIPIYKDNVFVGVVGIEIDYSTMVNAVNSLTLFENGYAFINDDDRKIVYHPRLDAADLANGKQPEVPSGMLNSDRFFRYTYEGVEKQAVWLPLSNGMRLNVSVPISEINASWHKLIYEIIGVSLVILIIFIFITTRFSEHLTKPLRDLTAAAVEVNNGNYDVDLSYEKSDEVGILTRSFRQLTSHLKVYITDLNSLAYADALTSVRNKGAFDIYCRDLQAAIEDSLTAEEFAVGVFDCNNLKGINDQFGHDKGDIYLKTASSLICRVFQHSPVFRTGGDEFAVILQNDDYQNRTRLVRLFKEQAAEISAAAKGPWEKVSISMGIAVYDPDTDSTVDDVTRRADKLMYENKFSWKAEHENGEER